MQFITGLSIVVIAILALLMGFSVLMGSRQKERAKAFWFFSISLLIAAGSVIIAMLFLNDKAGWELAWIPFVVGVGLIGVYCGILRQRIIYLDAKWLRFLSYVVVMSGAAIVYMVIFYLVLTYIFKIRDLPETIFVLNYIMVVILLLIFPVVNEVTGFINNLIRQGQVDLTYIIKRMNRMATEDINLDELSRFLARQLHFDYIGVVVGGKLYGSKVKDIKRSELRPISELGEPEYGIWQELSGETKELCEKLGVKAVAELRNAKGESFGQILVGRPLGKLGFERRDLIQIETIVNLVAAMIDTKATRLQR